MKKFDEEIVLAATQGDKTAINTLIEQYYEKILYTAIKRFDVDRGADVAHKAVVEIIQSLKNLKDPEKFEIWMMQLVNYVCLNEMKAKYHGQEMFVGFGDGDPDGYIETDSMEFIPEEYVIHVEKREQVLGAIDTLPQNYQDALMDFFFHEMSYEEISEVKGISINKVRNDLYRGKQLLKKRLEALEGKEFTYSVGIGALPILSQLFWADATATLTPEICSGFLGIAQKEIAKAGLSGGSVTTTSTVVKIVAGSVMSVGLATGILLSMNQNVVKEPVQPIVTTVQSTVQITEATTEEIPFVINTLEDMIGVDEAKQLAGFESGTVDESKWLAFLEHIGAEIELVSVEHETEYSMYLLHKQDKQLMLAERKNSNGSELSIFYQFGEIVTPPLMIEIIMQFESE